MSLQHAAKHLEKHGRNGDTVLVHMSKGEVKSLNDIAMAGGGHLTINPHTGLPEANFLKRMLPMVIGAGLAATGVGAPMAALMVGGGYTAATGSLKKGLMAGLGAYGGAGLAGSLTAAGASSVAPEAATAAAPEAAAVATPPAPIVDASKFPTGEVFQPPPSAGHTVVDSVGNVSRAMPRVEVAPVELPAASAPVTGTGSPMGGIGYPSQAVTPVPVTATAPPALKFDYISTGTGPGMKAPLDTSGARIANFDITNQQAPLEGNYNLARSVPSPAATATANPPALSPENMTTAQRFEAMKKGATFDNLVNYAKENPLQVASMAVTALTPEEKAREKKPVDSDPGQQFDYQANATSPTPMSDPYGREQKYYNQRYVPRAADGGFVKGVLERIGAAGGGGQSGMPEGYSYDANTQQYTKMASGGISDAGYNLGGYSDGGRLLRGPGDGVSDSIPAVIGKKQPARLADGEFVIPARIVSELGNGSTEAGARKLYAMMDRIQKARGKTVGKGKVAKNSRSEKYLPA